MDDTAKAFDIDFSNGLAYASDKTLSDYVRYVLGEHAEIPGANRFVVSGQTNEEVVLDRATGLIWQQGHATNGVWPEAMAYCEGMSLGGSDDWRLPSITELFSLIDVSSYDPASSFQDLTTGEFYSSTSHRFMSAPGVWSIDFIKGLLTITPESARLDVRCVKGGP